MPDDANIPEQYKNGFAEFHGLKFIVTSDVLIPRIETEQIVDEVVNSNAGSNILEVGTGSGCISISIAKLMPTAKILATDISDKALDVAKTNAKYHNMNQQITFVKSDLLNNVQASAADIIVANLPYIPSSRIDNLDSSVKDYEPHIALDGGEDGFEIYRRLFAQITEKSIIFKLLLAEIDETHSEIAQKESAKYFPEAKIKIVQDLFGYDRFISIKYK
jgi:release factor glutamine methyltransferase